MGEALATAVAAKMHDEFLRRLDLELARARAEGKRLAVSEFEWVAVPTINNLRAGRLQVLFVPLGAGEQPPRGRKWTIYNTLEPGHE